MQTVSHKKEMQIFYLNGNFPFLFVQFFFKINPVIATDEMDKLCNFHGNLTKNVDFII